MYEAKKSEQKILVDAYNYTPEMIASLDIESDKVRRGIPVNFASVIAICTYQSALQSIRKPPIRKPQKKWWHFWA